jgi:hypothetical protein
MAEIVQPICPECGERLFRQFQKNEDEVWWDCWVCNNQHLTEEKITEIEDGLKAIQ